LSREWSSDVSSSDLPGGNGHEVLIGRLVAKGDIKGAGENGRIAGVRVRMRRDACASRQHHALHIGARLLLGAQQPGALQPWNGRDRKSTRLNSSHVK